MFVCTPATRLAPGRDASRGDIHENGRRSNGI